MKTTLLLLSFFLIQNCHKTEFSEQPPFELESVSSQKWTGGQQQTGAGTHLEIQIKKELPKNCTLQRVYFQNQQAKIEKQNSTQFIACFYQKPKKDLILDSDPKKEYKNEAPEIQESKFNLHANEAILEFGMADKIYFFKIKNIPPKEALAYPVQNPRN